MQHRHVEVVVQVLVDSLKDRSGFYMLHILAMKEMGGVHMMSG